MLPTFIVIGAQKAGTTSLWSYLDNHPEVFVSQNKEPKFFVPERSPSQDLAWYESLFADAGEAKARGECSTDYTVFPVYGGVPARIAALLPEVRLVYLMRHPIERMRSAYAYGLWVGSEHRPIDEALTTDSRYIFQSQYAMQIEQYLPHFPMAQILPVKSEDLRTNREEALRRIFSFIGVDPELRPANLQSEMNTAEGRTRPRRWARRAGDVILRTGIDRRLPARVESWIGNHLQHPLLREPIPESDMTPSPGVVDGLRRYLQRDLRDLQAMIGPEFDCWGLLDEATPAAAAPGQGD